MANGIQFFVLTGDPGIGKTFITKKLCALMNDISIKTEGFYTEEVKNNRVREGFDVVTLDGNRGRLARDLSQLKEPVKHKVGKYGVLLKEFENVAMPSINKPEVIQKCLVIDEIGKMECFSDQFRIRIKEIFSPNSKHVVLATIPQRSNDPLINLIRHNTKAQVWTVTRENRNTIPQAVFDQIKSAFDIK